MARESIRVEESALGHRGRSGLGTIRLNLGILLVASIWACGTSSTNTGSDNSSGSSGNSGNSTGSNASSGNNSGSTGSNETSGSTGQASTGTGGIPATGADAGTIDMQAGLDATSPSEVDSSSGGAGDATADGGTGAGACTRAGLTAAINSYFTALAAHDPTMAPLSSSVKYTENGVAMQVGSGEWKTASAVKFKRSALDTDICDSVTESVIGDSTGDLVYGVRLRLENQQITEIETIPVHSGDYITISASGLESTSTDDWETVLPAAQQSTRDALQSLMDVYFTRFPSGACNFASTCTRVEDGESIGSCTGFGIGCVDSGAGAEAMTARLHVIDVDAGISVGFTMFAGAYTDFHMFKVRGGQVQGVHAILASAKSSGWN